MTAVLVRAIGAGPAGACTVDLVAWVAAVAVAGLTVALGVLVATGAGFAPVVGVGLTVALGAFAAMGAGFATVVVLATEGWPTGAFAGATALVTEVVLDAGAGFAAVDWTFGRIAPARAASVWVGLRGTSLGLTGALRGVCGATAGTAVGFACVLAPAVAALAGSAAPLVPAGCLVDEVVLVPAVGLGAVLPGFGAAEAVAGATVASFARESFAAFWRVAESADVEVGVATEE